jgi:hypothetical protein
MKFIETSAKTSLNVEDAFVIMTKEIISQMVEKERTMTKKEPSRENISLNKKQGEKLDVDKK